MAASPNASLECSGRPVKVTNPDKVFFPARGAAKPAPGDAPAEQKA